MKKKLLAGTFGSLTLLSLVAGFLIPAYGDHIAKPYDWTVELETRKLEHQFDYVGSHLKGVEKVKVSYQQTPTAENPEPTRQHYENFWYHDGKPLGLERLHAYEITQGDGVSILIKHNDEMGSDKECKAAANAILRVILDSYLNKNAVVNVRIPPESFEKVRDYLMELGCLQHLPSGDDTVSSSINIFLQTDPDPTQTETLYYI